MEQVRSGDGTLLAYERSGSGPPLLLVHGTGADHTRWAPVLPGLEARYTVYALDRRGRGGSGDAEPYAMEREFDDVAAVVDAIGEPVNLLGHSYGAICALEAARRTGNIRKLVLYEAPIPIPPGSVFISHALIDEIQACVDAGDRDGATEILFRDVVRVPPEQIAALRASPVWQARVAAAHTLARELWAVERYVFEPERFATAQTPTLQLLGGDSPAFFRTSTDAIAAALPDCRVAVMPGQQHVVMNTAPDLFVSEVNQFLDGA